MHRQSEHHQIWTEVIRGKYVKKYYLKLASRHMEKRSFERRSILVYFFSVARVRSASAEHHC